MDFWDIEKQVIRGHAYFAERTIRGHVASHSCRWRRTSPTLTKYG